MKTKNNTARKMLIKIGFVFLWDFIMPYLMVKPVMIGAQLLTGEWYLSPTTRVVATLIFIMLMIIPNMLVFKNNKLWVKITTSLLALFMSGYASVVWWVVAAEYL